MITTINAPRINANDEKVEVVAWHIEPGARVEAGQHIADLETAKTAVTIEAEFAGFIHPLVKKGDIVRVGAPLYVCAATRKELDAASIDESQVISAVAGDVKRVASGGDKPYGSTQISRAAARLMEERGLSAADFEGAGLVTARFVLEHLGGKASKSTKPQLAIDTKEPATARSEKVSLAKQAEIGALTTGESGNVNSTLTIYFDTAPIRNRLLNDQSFDGSIQPIILFENLKPFETVPTTHCLL